MFDALWANKSVLGRFPAAPHNTLLCPVTNTSVNPARSTAVALFADAWALEQLWLFWIAPLIGAIVGAGIWKALLSDSHVSE